MNMVTAYLYGSLENKIHKKVFEEFKMPEAYIQSLKICISLDCKYYYMVWRNLDAYGITILVKTK